MEDLELDLSTISLDSCDTVKTTSNSENLCLNQLDMSLNKGARMKTSSNEDYFPCPTLIEPDTSSEVTLYNYQNELAEKGKTGVNSIICSPTGSGKTITAASVIKHHLEKAKNDQRPYRVLYLVHIRYLVRHLATDVSTELIFIFLLNNSI